MENYKQLVLQLRNTVSVSKRQMLDAAADAIMTLLAEKEQLKAERDAALDDLKTLVRFQDPCEVCGVERNTEACEEAGWDCDDCKAVGTCDCVDCGVGSHFKWRGISPGYNTNMQ